MKVLVRPAYRLFEIMKDKMHYFDYKWYDSYTYPVVAYAVNNILKCALPYDIKFETLVVLDTKMLLRHRLPKTNAVVTCAKRGNIDIPDGRLMIYNNFDKKEYLERMNHLPCKEETCDGWKRYTDETLIYELYNPCMTINMKQYFDMTPHRWTDNSLTNETS
jgi:hypothetical protein